MGFTREMKVGVFVLTAILLFVYMGIAIGTFGADSLRYHAYTFVYPDVTGLVCKSEVKVAGVKVGWVKDIQLFGNNSDGVVVHVCVDKRYQIYADASAIVRQDGVLGPYYLELIPGMSVQQPLEPGSLVPYKPHQTASVATVLQSMQTASGELQQLLPACTRSVEAFGDLLTHDARRLVQTTNDTAASIQQLVDRINHVWNRFEQLSFVFDGHVEHMFRQAEHYCHRDTKGFFNARIFVTPDYFYFIGVSTSQKGYIRRETTLRDYTNDCMQPICDGYTVLPPWAQYAFLYNVSRQEIKRDAWRVELQFGKNVTDHLALRVGLFEGTAGVAADIDCPMGNTRRMIVTCRLYDFRGRLRINDPRPHLKLIARLFVCKQIYIAFGVDDAVSKCNASFFLGAGFRFGDTDMKYFLPNYVGS